MKVCIMNSFYSPDILGGAEISVKILAERLRDLDIEVFVIATGESDSIDYVDGVKIYRINIDRTNTNRTNTAKKYISGERPNKIKKIKYKISEIRNKTINLKIDNILKEENPDLVHVNNIYGISTEIWRVCKLRNIKVVQTLRDYFFICPKATLKCEKNKKCKNNLVCITYRKLFKYLTKNIDYITAPSKYVINEFLNIGYFDSEKCKCVYNAIDIDESELSNIYKLKMSRESTEINFIYLGALSPYKGLVEIVEAFKIIDNENIKLHIAGKGELESFIKQSIIEDDRINYYGFISGIELENLLKKGDVLVAPSLWEEPFGRIVLDAYKYAMPVIVSNRGGLPEIVDDRKTGIILDSVNIDTVKNALKYFIDDRNKIKLMLSNTKAKIYEFTINKQIKEFNKIYTNLIKE